jgi:hypothetical protein
LTPIPGSSYCSDTHALHPAFPAALAGNESRRGGGT